jgi:glycosyltransferase involved in cell wall biosynthesis
MPKFSLVIPTRTRADTLIHALRTATDQEYDDLEILVHESGDDAETANVVASTADRRVRHVKTVQPVSMSENWERALNCAAGEYITFFGDDDGMLPDACAAAAEILHHNPTDLLSWRPASYYWPRYFSARHRNRLIAHVRRPDTIEEHSSRVALELFYRFRCDYSHLPMIYHSFVSRALVKRVQAKAGSYFIGSAPDVVSGIVNAFFSESFLVAGRPLSSGGLSHNSTGHRMFFSHDDSLRREATAQAFSANGGRGPTRNLKLFIGDEMLSVKQRLFPNDPPSFHYRSLLWTALQSLNDTPGEYTEMLAEICAAASRNGVSIESWIEPQAESRAVPAQGIRATSDGVFMDIDCSRASITNIHEVTRLLSALLPPFAQPKLIRMQEPLVSVPNDRDTVLQFGVDGNGLLFLGYGWSEPEPWGVWSLGSSSEIALTFYGQPTGTVEMRIEGRMLLHAQRLQSRGAILCNGRRMAEFEASAEHPKVSLLLSLSSEEFANGELVIGFEVEKPRSPAEDGISSDTRRLGFGLEEIAIKCER